MPTSNRAGSSSNRHPDEDGWGRVHRVVRDIISDRTEILCALARGPVRVCELADEVHMDIRAISHHLGRLYAVGLVQFSKRGRDHVYQLAKSVRIERRKDRIFVRIDTGLGGAITLSIPDTSTDLSRRL